MDGQMGEKWVGVMVDWMVVRWVDVKDVLKAA